MIGLKEILNAYPTYDNEGGYDKAYVLEAMRRACEQTVDVCIEQVLDENDPESMELIEAIRENILQVKSYIK